MELNCWGRPPSLKIRVLSFSQRRTMILVTYPKRTLVLYGRHQYFFQMVAETVAMPPFFQALRQMRPAGHLHTTESLKLSAPYALMIYGMARHTLQVQRRIPSLSCCQVLYHQQVRLGISFLPDFKVLSGFMAFQKISRRFQITLVARIPT